MIEVRRHDVTREDRADGSIVLGSGHALGPVARTALDWLDRWETEAPERVFVGERSGAGWREASYAETAAAVRAVAAGLLGRGIGPGDRIAVLSGPSVDHAILALAAQTIGAVLVPLAEQYSLVGEARGRLVYCARKMRPALVYAADAERFGAALALEVFDRVPVLASATAGAPRPVTAFADLLRGDPGADVAAARAATGPETLAKILFTSGSTSDPKGVPQTQAMMCVNQAQYLAALPVLGARPHRMLDWLPWNHTFSGNSNFNMMLSNGGSLYIDDGKPVTGLFARSLENLRMKPPTLGFDVPIAHAMRVAAMQGDAGLRRAYFAGQDIFFYAGASLPGDVWRAVEEMALAERGELPLMISSWGMTETAPCALIYHERGGKSGMIGVPVPELRAKLLPVGVNRFELRVAGPSIFGGYYDDPARTAESFDDEGFFVTGDAVRFADPADVSRGLVFDGRIGEDFKLMSGTWVRAGTLRLDLLPELARLVQDVVVVGEGRGEVGLLVFPAPGRWRDAPPGDGAAVIDPVYAAALRAVLADAAARATGSSMRIARAIVLAEPPSVADGEITAKGSLNTRAITARRAGMLARLYDDADPAVIRV